MKYMQKRFSTLLLAVLLLVGCLIGMTGCEPALPYYPSQISNSRRLVGIGDTMRDIEKVFGRGGSYNGEELIYYEHGLTVYLRDEILTGFVLEGVSHDVISYRHVCVGGRLVNLQAYFEKLYQLDDTIYAASFSGRDAVEYGEGDTLIVYTIGQDDLITSITISKY